jgi:hypothetical protein
MHRVFNRGTLTECPVCQGLDPDPRGRGFCGLCGAVYRNQVSAMLRFAKIAVALGVVLLVTAAIVTLALELNRLLGLALAVGGASLLAGGLFFSRRVSSAMLAALGLRTAPETIRLLKSANRLHLVVLALAVLGLMAAGPYYVRVAAPRREQSEYQERFAAHIQQYLSLVPADAPLSEDATPYIRGRIVAIDKTAQGGTLSAVHLALPDELRAQSPDDVGTIVLIEWREVRAGIYGDSGIVAYRIYADVTIVDEVKKSVVGRETFVGGDPPDTAPSGGGPGRGSQPVSEIVTRLEELAQKPAESAM